MEYFINKIKQLFENNEYGEVIRNLEVVEYVILRCVLTKDYETLSMIVEGISSMFDENLTTDQQSFIQGKLSSIINISR